MLYSRTVKTHSHLLRVLALCAAAALLSGCMMPDPEKRAAENEKRLAAAGIIALKAGDTAPQFSAVDQNGVSVSPLAGVPALSLLDQPALDSAVPTAAAPPAATPATPPSAAVPPVAEQAAEQKPTANAAAASGGQPPAAPATPAAGGQGYTVLFFFPALNAPNGTAELLALQQGADQAGGAERQPVCDQPRRARRE